MDRSQYLVRKMRLGEEPESTDLDHLTPGERIALVWPITLQTLAFAGKYDAEPRLARHIVKVCRARRGVIARLQVKARSRPHRRP